MFINKLNQLYRPKRILFYKEVTKEEKDAFYKGVVPECIGKYNGSFGTYDAPGVFLIDSLDEEVIGIEFRIDDDRIEYPKDLKSIELHESFFYLIEIDEEIRPTREYIDVTFAEIAKDSDAHRIYSDLSIKENPGIICVFTGNKKIRIFYECNLDHDRAKDLIDNNVDSLDKEYLYKMAFFDPITNHYNWNHLVSFIEMPMDGKINDFSFVHFDIKEFRIINEAYGHIAANKVLCNVVKAMNEADFVYASARCHNDNFAMIIKDMPEKETMDTLREFFEKLSFLEEDPGYKIYYRAGVVPMRRSMLSGNRVADAGKMVQALGTKHNETEIIMYTDKMHDDLSWGNYIKAYYETAIEQEEFLVYLQPKFSIKEDKIKGAEALIRWNYKNREFLPPYRFIPFFEKDGAIGKIDDVVLKKVCEALAIWKQQGKQLYPISVNLSRDRLYEKDLIAHLTKIVDSYNVSHELIDFELTESATYDDTDQMIEILEGLRDKGFKISMDDFGTGYSSLSLLTRMPINTLKIDKGFVDKVCAQDEKEEDIIVLKHIIALCKELGFGCLAEGAESKEQVMKLSELGCEIIQGYYYSKPIPMEEYDKKYL